MKRDIGAIRVNSGGFRNINMRVDDCDLPRKDPYIDIYCPEKTVIPALLLSLSSTPARTLSLEGKEARSTRWWIHHGVLPENTLSVTECRSSFEHFSDLNGAWANIGSLLKNKEQEYGRSSLSSLYSIIYLDYCGVFDKQKKEDIVHAYEQWADPAGCVIGITITAHRQPLDGKHRPYTIIHDIVSTIPVDHVYMYRYTATGKRALMTSLVFVLGKSIRTDIEVTLVSSTSTPKTSLKENMEKEQAEEKRRLEFVQWTGDLTRQMVALRDNDHTIIKGIDVDYIYIGNCMRYARVSQKQFWQECGSRNSTLEYILEKHFCAFETCDPKKEKDGKVIRDCYAFPV